MKVLFVLQNAYKSDKYNFRNEEEWYMDLKRSHSGRRLKEMMPDGAEIYVVNSSANIGDCVSSAFPADTDYIKTMIKKIKPNRICGCGKIAQEGLKKCGVDFISAPHPAWRCLSKRHTEQIKTQLSSGE